MYCRKGMNLRFNLYSLVSTSALPPACALYTHTYYVCRREDRTAHKLD